MQIDTVLLKVASRCNFDCKYCYVYNLGDTGWKTMPKVMSEKTVEEVIGNLSELATAQDRGFAVVVHGGEPLLLGERILRKLLCGLRASLPSDSVLSVQSNGTLVSEEFISVLKAAKSTVSISIDGPQEVHDANRLDHSGNGTHHAAEAAVRFLIERAPEVFSGVLAVVDPRSDPLATYEYFKALGAPSVDYLFSDGNHSRMPKGKESFESTEYGDWLNRIWDLYTADSNPARINILDDLARLVLGGVSCKEGKGQIPYGVFVIETDGSVAKNDTLKSTKDRNDRFTTSWNVETDRLSNVVKTQEFEAYGQLQLPTSRLCMSCEHLAVCGGGMPLYRWSDEEGFNNPSVYCRDHQKNITHIRRHLQSTGALREASDRKQ